MIGLCIVHQFGENSIVVLLSEVSRHTKTVANISFDIFDFSKLS